MSDKPMTAYDYRRYIELVQVLAMDNSSDGLRALCKAWNIEPYIDEGNFFYGYTLEKLAKAVIEYHRNEAK